MKIETIQIEKEMICAECGYVGKRERFSKGNYLLEIFLWCLFFIPGVLYTTWRAFSEYHACPICKNEEMTPLESDFGKEIATEKQRLKNLVSKKEQLEIIAKIMRS